MQGEPVQGETLLKPFRVPETRLLAINELVAQVTLTYRTDEDEEMGYRYEQDSQLQQLVQTAVVSLVNCGYTNGVARGPGFVLHQLRKKWPIGRRYIFTRNGEPLQSSLHKYFFQLELVDDDDDRPMLEITEVRGVAQSVSSVAGSTIEGLDAVTLPPMAAIFGQGVPPESIGHHRRSGSAYSGRSVHSSLLMHSPPRFDPARRPESPSHPPRATRDMPPGGRTSRLSEYGAPRTSADGDPDITHSGTPAGPRPPQDGSAGSPGQNTVRTRSISRSSVGSMQSVERMVDAGAHTPARAMQPSSERLGRTPWYRSLHGISPLSRQPKSLSSSDNEALLGAAAKGTGPTQIPRIAGGATEPARIPRVAGTPEPTRIPRAPGTSAALRPPPGPASPPGLGGIASRLRRKILSPISMPRQQHQQRALERPSSRASDAGAPAAAAPSAIPASEMTPEKRPLEEEEPPSTGGIRRPDMPPPSKRPTPRSQKTPEPLPESVPIPTAVKNALLRRLKSPLGWHADRSSSRLSVRDRIAAFNSLSVDSKSSSHRTPSAEASALPTPVTRSPTEGEPGKAAGVAARPSLPITPVSSGRVRVGTTTGFVSVAAGRPLSRASSATGGRAASPALSQMSAISTRVQDAINSLERASAGAAPPLQPPLSASRIGMKRGANGPLESLASPTKRPRAPSAAADKPETNGASRINPLSMVQRMVRRNTDH